MEEMRLLIHDGEHERGDKTCRGPLHRATLANRGWLHFDNGTGGEDHRLLGKVLASQSALSSSSASCVNLVVTTTSSPKTDGSLLTW